LRALNRIEGLQLLGLTTLLYILRVARGD
jgi:hypothetical protein